MTKPGYGRSNSSDKESRWFKYPRGRDFFSYDKIFLPINQRDNHWTLCVIDIRHRISYHYNSCVITEEDIEADNKVMVNIEKSLDYEYTCSNQRITSMNSY